MSGHLCQICQKRPATVHLTMADGQAAHACATCLERHQIDPVTDPDQLLQATVNPSPSEKLDTPSDPEAAAIRCPGCGLDLATFSANHRFGCARCYEAFSGRVSALLTDIQDGPAHVGRLPLGAAPTGLEQRIRQRRDLLEQLQKAVAAEDYERAATLRDRIQELGGAPA